VSFAPKLFTADTMSSPSRMPQNTRAALHLLRQTWG